MRLPDPYRATRQVWRQAPKRLEDLEELLYFYYGEDLDPDDPRPDLRRLKAYLREHRGKTYAETPEGRMRLETVARLGLAGRMIPDSCLAYYRGFPAEVPLLYDQRMIDIDKKIYALENPRLILSGRYEYGGPWSVLDWEHDAEGVMAELEPYLPGLNWESALEECPPVPPTTTDSTALSRAVQPTNSIAEGPPTPGPLALTFDNPQTALALRYVAWEKYQAGRSVRATEVLERLNQARRDLGLGDYRGGGGWDWIQNRMYARHIRRAGEDVVLLDRAWARPERWRLLLAPRHGLVRELSRNPVVTLPPLPGQPLALSLRDPLLPGLDVWVLEGGTTNIPESLHGRKCLYVLLDQSEDRDGSQGALYAGRTDEPQTRWRIHRRNMSVRWAVFISPQDAIYREGLATDAFAVGESLLISFLAEIARVKNRDRGRDTEPAFAHTQQGVGLSTGAASCLLWAVKNQASIGLGFELQLPFLRPRLAGWNAGESYLA